MYIYIHLYTYILYIRISREILIGINDVCTFPQLRHPCHHKFNEHWRLYNSRAAECLTKKNHVPNPKTSKKTQSPHTLRVFLLIHLDFRTLGSKKQSQPQLSHEPLPWRFRDVARTPRVVHQWQTVLVSLESSKTATVHSLQFLHAIYSQDLSKIICQWNHSVIIYFR